MQGLLVFHSLEQAIREGYQVYYRISEGYMVRTRTAQGWALALVVLR